MQHELFPIETPLHEAGGKVKLRLPPDVRGDARFSSCQRYRPLLRRWTGERFPADYAMFIGMNPSTAEGHVNDPTVAREWEFTVREGLSGYLKTNVADYRATAPKDLLQEGVIVCSDENLPTIIEAALGARLVILCHGKLNRALVDSGARTVAALRKAGVQLKCFGTNADGSPKHPLYLRKDTPLADY